MEPGIETRPTSLFDQSIEPYNLTDFCSADIAQSADRSLFTQNVRTETLNTTDVLDEIACDWCHAIKDIRIFGDIVTVTASVTINSITREGLGSSNAKNGTGFKSAEESALRDAASKFKIDRKLKMSSPKNNRTPDHSFQDISNHLFNPIAQNLADQITAKQHSMIREFGREIGLDTYSECSRIMRCNITELSRLAASLFIEHLQATRRKTNTMGLQLARFTA